MLAILPQLPSMVTEPFHVQSQYNRRGLDEQVLGCITELDVRK